MPRPPIAPAHDGVDLRLPRWIRDVVRSTAAQLRELYASETAADDPAIARLFPTAYLDDPLAGLAFDDRVADGLREGRLDAIATVERTADARRLTAEEADAWIRTLNDARLVLGTRLDVTEDSTEEDFRGDPFRPDMFRHYGVMGAIVDGLVQALSGEAVN